MYIRSSTPDRLFGLKENQENHFKRPLTSMKSSLQRLSEIGSQINDIITKWKLTRHKHHYHFKKSSVQYIGSNNYESYGTETERSLYSRLKQQQQISMPKYLNNSLNCKSENLTSRIGIKKQKISSSIITNKINSLISSQVYENDYFELPSIPTLLQYDPNQTHLVVCCKNFKIYLINQYSKKIQSIGQHYRPIKAMTKIIIQNSHKMFYTSSEDGQINQWKADSMLGIFKQQQSIRIAEPPIQLYLDSEGTLYILTANLFIFKNHKITLRGFVKDFTFSLTHAFIAIDSFIHSINLITQEQIIINLDKQIKSCTYDEKQLYILSTLKTLIVFDEINKKFSLNSEIDLDADQLFCMANNLILLIKDQDISLYSAQKRREYKIMAPITCVLPLTQQILVGDTTKILQILKF